jgi:hypothetical protein
MRYLAAFALLLAFACSKGKSKNEPQPESKQIKTPDAAAAASPDLPKHTVYPSAKAAFAKILETEPRVLGIGEYHQTNKTAHIESAVATFEAEMLDALGELTSDLVIETYISAGKCGETEKVVTETVRKDTQRPETVETELSRLIKHARELGVEPHILRMTCEDFESMLVDGEVDYLEKLLWVTRELSRVTNSAVAYRAGPGKKAEGYDPKRSMIAVYSGAHHNALSPQEGLDSISYVGTLDKAVAEGYVEVDLYVPEFITGLKTAAAEPAYALLERADKDHVLLIERSPRSYVIMLQRDRVASNARK